MSTKGNIIIIIIIIIIILIRGFRAPTVTSTTIANVAAFN